ncbi:hypothetical protein NQ314_016726 [Rhamnusium bicolor]|uniref:Uncharacterized protein n=1 Tax=Rhamnusium bicolor TaxID=1586634 RepID=A0AAV8WV63_9CUCU|nr:hypothetical protein NQ314_016726 [Rhamnusium bicolor]
MEIKILFFLSSLAVLTCIILRSAESRSVQNNFHSDVIITHWPTPATTKGKDTDNEENEPGFMRKQLMKFGQVASRVGNAMGAHATKVTSAVEKICEIVKTIIPLFAAICHVGQFKFCAATTETPDRLSEALSPDNLDLSIPDK